MAFHVSDPAAVVQPLRLRERPALIEAAPKSHVRAPGDRYRPVPLSAEQKLRAERLTSLFENSTLELQYGYAEALGDGRGVTAGRAGFTSGTGDMLDVVQRYTHQVKDNPLARYLPRLKQLASNSSGSTKGLEGLETAWVQAAKDPTFRAVQDAVIDETYFRPSQAHADALGLRTPLARAALYDAVIQHGDGEDPDGLPALIERTNQQVQGTPRSGVSEQDWLKAFLAVRHADLAHANDPETREVWSQSVGRVEAFQAIQASGNYGLHGPLRLDTADYHVTVP